MTPSAAGLAFIQGFEGCSLTAYQDSAGRWSIGYGHTQGVSPGDTCTQAQADSWFAADLAWTAAAVNKLVTVPLTQNQFEALCSLTYNIGVDALRNSTLLADLNAGNTAAAARWFAQWDHADGIELAGLERRRLAEEKLFTT